MYVRVWEYHVDPERAAAFIDAYDAAGDWARLFEHGAGYAGTDLYRDTADPTRFVTVDRWSSASAWRAFLAQHREAYDALDARTAGLSRSQRALLEGTGPGAP